MTSNLVTVPAEVGVDVSSTISQHPVYFLVGGRGTFTMDAVSRAVNRLTLFVAKPGAPRDPENLHPCFPTRDWPLLHVFRRIQAVPSVV